MKLPNLIMVSLAWFCFYSIIAVVAILTIFELTPLQWGLGLMYVCYATAFLINILFILRKWWKEEN